MLRTMMVTLFAIGLPVLGLLPAEAVAQEVTLPPGLGGPTEEKGEEEVSLPEGLGEPGDVAQDTAEEPATPARRRLADAVTGFAEMRVGSRLQGDAVQGELSIAELRLQMGGEWEAGDAVFRLVADGVLDGVSDVSEPDLTTGQGAIDLREANVVFRPTGFMDVKAGRQILTWGVGDLVFINDLFPKDYVSFFTGRDDEYLKAPSDALRASFFADQVSVDVVYTPQFDPDRHVTGERLSWYNPGLGRISGEDAVISPLVPDTVFDEDEIALRAYRQAGPFEIAAYAYDGYFKSPAGMDATGAFLFPPLSVYGASLRGPLAGGIVTAEAGRYISRDDEDGTDPFLPNSQTRVLAGFEREVATDLTAAIQYYAEIRSDHDAWLASLPPGAARADETRHVVTMRLTRLAMNQNLVLSAFNFWSPNEDDGYLRFRASYKASDTWLVEGGGNAFYGPQQSAQFSQFKDNTNLFFAIRKSF